MSLQTATYWLQIEQAVNDTTTTYASVFFQTNERNEETDNKEAVDEDGEWWPWTFDSYDVDRDRTTGWGLSSGSGASAPWSNDCRWWSALTADAASSVGRSVNSITHGISVGKNQNSFDAFNLFVNRRRMGDRRNITDDDGDERDDRWSCDFTVWRDVNEWLLGYAVYVLEMILSYSIA